MISFRCNIRSRRCMIHGLSACMGFPFCDEETDIHTIFNNDAYNQILTNTHTLIMLLLLCSQKYGTLILSYQQ